MAKQFTLGKNERLRSRKAIDQLFTKGRSFSISPYKVFYSIPASTGLMTEPSGKKASNIQFGVGVSSKNFKKAVDRNRIKRLTRDAYRTQNTELRDFLQRKNWQLNVFFVYVDRQMPDFNMVRTKVSVALHKLLQLVKEAGPP